MQVIDISMFLLPYVIKLKTALIIRCTTKRKKRKTLPIKLSHAIDHKILSDFKKLKGKEGSS